MEIEIRPAHVPLEMQLVRDLFAEYQEWLAIDL